MGEGERNPEIFLTCKIENEKKNKNMFRNFRKKEKQTEKKRNGKHITQEKRRWEGENQTKSMNMIWFYYQSIIEFN